MRQIESESRLVAKRKRRQMILSVLMVVILLGSTAGYAISLFSRDSATPVTNDGPYFDGVSWVVPYGGTYLSLQSSPDEAAAVPLEGTVSLSTFQGVPVYIDAESESIKQEVGSVIGMVAERVQEACYGPCNRTTLPEKDCSEPLIIWKGSETRRIYTNASCVFIEGDYVAADAFLYRLLGYI